MKQKIRRTSKRYTHTYLTLDPTPTPTIISRLAAKVAAPFTKKYGNYKIWEWSIIVIVTSPVLIPFCILFLLPMIAFYPISFLIPKSILNPNNKSYSTKRKAL